MEKQMMQMIKQSFPVDSSEEETSANEDTNDYK